jgi:hypothetical protein
MLFRVEVGSMLSFASVHSLAAEFGAVECVCVGEEGFELVALVRFSGFVPVGFGVGAARLCGVPVSARGGVVRVPVAVASGRWVPVGPTGRWVFVAS